ncbi:hypothetical protein Cgig2_025709 [Carnegiea gigantea]|uniref:Uncharacterized protein n=1 Tax=Carnegiea gigantea TaxID=171969 RepID=A0A9Q1K3T0_9CARY|nr:hypothetical protein Cgig2_025709 [Carnegiea gigantea]
METKVKRSNFTKVVENLQEWEYYVNSESHDRGRVWVMRRKTDFQVRIIESIVQAIHCEILHTFTNKRFVLTAVYEVIFHPEDTSDHYPGVLSFFEIHKQGRKAFRFLDMWATNPQFPQIVRDIWSTSIQGTKMFAISIKLELLQHPLRKLNKEVFGDVQVQYAEAKNALNDIMQQPQNELLYTEEKVTIENVQPWKQRLDSFYKQKSKKDLLNLDDTNGKYFHTKLKQRYHFNRIASYQMEDGQWTWDYDKAIAHFVSCYKDLLITSVPV